MDDKLPFMTGFVEIDILEPDTDRVIRTEVLGPNMITNNMRQYLVTQLAPRIITGRPDNSDGPSSWFDRRIAMIGFGVGDAALVTPTVIPENPEDGRTRLVAEPAFPDSLLGLQRPLKRDAEPAGPSLIHSAASPIDAWDLLKEVDTDGIEIVQISGGGAEIRFAFTIGTAEYVGNILEMGLYMGGGDAADSTALLPVAPLQIGRLDPANAIMVARKTRASLLEKTRDFRFRARWRIRS